MHLAHGASDGPVGVVWLAGEKSSVVLLGPCLLLHSEVPVEVHGRKEADEALHHSRVEQERMINGRHSRRVDELHGFTSVGRSTKHLKPDCVVVASRRTAAADLKGGLLVVRERPGSRAADRVRPGWGRPRGC
jgi:hypothetical protein